MEIANILSIMEEADSMRVETEALRWETPEEIDQALAKRMRRVRKRRSISQQRLSEQSGVSLGSIKRFESTGMISLLSLTKLAMALGMEDELRTLFDQVIYHNIEEVIYEGR